MKPFKTAAPFLLALLIVSAGFFGSGAVSRLLPDYTGQVFPGVKQEGIQNAFFSGAGNETLVYPWNLFDRSACLTLRETGANRPEAGAALCRFLKDAGEPFSSIDWEDRILADPKSGLVYLPETELPGDAPEGKLSFSMALNSRYVCYLHQFTATEEPPMENPGEKVRNYVEEARRALERTGMGTASSMEESEQGDTPYPEETPAPEDAQKQSMLLDYLYGTHYLNSALTYGSELTFPDEDKIIQIMCDLVQYADYTTLSREGETLIAFSQNRRGAADSLVLYYHESLDAIVGFSLQLGE